MEIWSAVMIFFTVIVRCTDLLPNIVLLFLLKSPNLKRFFKALSFILLLLWTEVLHIFATIVDIPSWRSLAYSFVSATNTRVLGIKSFIRHLFQAQVASWTIRVSLAIFFDVQILVHVVAIFVPTSSWWRIVVRAVSVISIPIRVPRTVVKEHFLEGILPLDPFITLFLYYRILLTFKTGDKCFSGNINLIEPLNAFSHRITFFPSNSTVSLPIFVFANFLF